MYRKGEAATMHARRLCAALMLLSVRAGLAQAPAPPAVSNADLTPFAAHYTADWKSINVGTSDLELSRDGRPDHYVYTWSITARGIFRLMYSSDVIQTSWFSVAGGQVRPEKYRAQQGDDTVSLDFDWEGGHARGEAEKKPVDLRLKSGTQDIMSIQAQVMVGLRNGDLPATFHIIEKDQVKDFIYTQEGAARIRTVLGELDTVVVASQRSGNNRVLRMWFAPSLGYVPVQAERSRNGKLEFAMRIKTLKR
jgi:hypothetical protein